MTEPTKHKPTVPFVLPLVMQVYELPDYAHVIDGRVHVASHRVGGHLHIAIEDGNLERGHIQFCLDEAERDGCAHCVLVAWLMLQMTRRQLAKVYAGTYRVSMDAQAKSFALEAFCPCAYHMRERRTENT